MPAREPIPCVVFAFQECALARKTLDALSLLGDRLSITVVENRSDLTDEVLKPYFLELLRSERIDRYIAFRANITNNALEIAFENYLVPLGSSEFVLITDADVEPDRPDWLDEQIAILRAHPDVMLCGVGLSKANLPIAAFPEAARWIPDPAAIHEDYVETKQSGVHLWLIRTAALRAVLRYRLVTGKRFVDATFAAYCARAGCKWALTKKAEAKHLVWDLYAERDHRYTRQKKTTSYSRTWCHYRYVACDLFTRERRQVCYPFFQWAQLPYTIGLRWLAKLCMFRPRALSRVR